MKKTNVMTDPPKARRIRIKKKGSRNNEFVIDVTGDDAFPLDHYQIKIDFQDVPGTTEPFDVYRQQKETELSTQAPIVSDYLETANAEDPKPAAATITWIIPGSTTSQEGVTTKWETDVTTQIGFFARILNFLRSLFGKN
jgi:hypothetical protein